MRPPFEGSSIQSVSACEVAPIEARSRVAFAPRGYVFVACIRTSRVVIAVRTSTA